MPPVAEAIRALPDDGRSPDLLIVLLHGKGDDGSQLIERGRRQHEFDWPTAFPRAALFAPHGLEANGDDPGDRRWFDRAEHHVPTMQANIARAVPIVSRLIADELYRLARPASRCVIVGFSQGGMLALPIALGFQPSIGGVACFSGTLPPAGADPPRSRPPTLLVHGEADEIVPLDWTRGAEAWLQVHDVKVNACYLPGLGHRIDTEAASLGHAFIRRISFCGRDVG